jgi:hypothetical protein
MSMKPRLLDDLHAIESFMFTSDYLSKSRSYLKTNVEPYIPVKNNSLVQHVITPEYSDKLFWCFYIIHKGIDDYNYIGQKVFSVETEMKIKLVELVREKREILKQYKISAKNVEIDLANNPWISITTFHALCIIYSISAMIIKNKICYNINIDSGINAKLPKVIHYNNHNNFSLETDTTIDKVMQYNEKLWVIHNWDKPLLAISAYKVSELRSIGEKLGIELLNISKFKNKTELYQDILKKI